MPTSKIGVNQIHTSTIRSTHKSMRTIDDLKTIKNSRVLIRVNYDIPSIDATQRISDSFGTISQLLNQNNCIILLSHWGRPTHIDPTYSLEQQVSVIEDLYNTSIDHHISHPISITFFNQYKETLESLDSLAKQLDSDIYNLQKAHQSQETKTHTLYLLENVRFDPREQSDNYQEQEAMAEEYAQLADYFIDEAFPLSHRHTATNTTICDYLPHGYGISYQQELTSLRTIATQPQHPFIILSGGAKLETKLPILKQLAQHADFILVGGQLCFPLLQAKGITLPNISIDTSELKYAQDLLTQFPSVFILPDDFFYGHKDQKIDSPLLVATTNTSSHIRVPRTHLPYDIGTQTIKKYSTLLNSARSVFWNGPLGKYEQGYTTGTEDIARVLGSLSQCYKVLGGGDSIASMSQSALDSFDFVSTGGGATLHFLAQSLAEQTPNTRSLTR